MSKAIAILTVLLAVGVCAEVEQRKQVPLYAVEAEWAWHSFTITPKACDPPAPKDAAIVCGEPTKYYAPACPDRTIGLLPPEAARYGYDTLGGSDGTHPAVYCIVLGEAKP